MYKRKFRVGLGAGKKSVASTSSSTSIASVSVASNPQLTSTPIEKDGCSQQVEPVAGPSGVLTERANIPVSQVPVTQKKQPAIISNDDDFMIPASQFVQQSRYVSQRSIRMRSQLSTTQQTPLSYFESVLSRCGVELTARNSDVSYTINCDHLKFVIRLRKELSSHPKYPENVQHFLSGLVDTMKTPTQLNKVLSGCRIILPNSDLWKDSQESLMNDFLMIDFMQKDIIEILMNKIKILAVDNIQTSQMDIFLLLAQLKFVDHLSHGDFVAEKIFEIIEIASNDARPTIIKSLEDIIDLNRHNEIIEKLMDLIPDDEDLLTESTIDTFGNMCLNANIHYLICQKIIRYIKNNAPNSLLPCFTKFILKFNAEEIKKLPEIIDSLRSCLKWPQELPTTRVAIQNNQREVFGCISRSLIRSKQLFDVWLKRIQSNTDVHKPIDFVILLLLMTINEEKSLAIENIIRRKIKSDLFQVKLLEETIRLLPAILLENSVVLFELLDSFVRDKNPLISNFANVGYRLIFGIDSCDRKVLLSRLIGFVCERNAHALSLADSATTANKASSSSDITTSALMILSEINRKYPNEMKHNGNQILRLIDYSGDFSLVQFRLVMNIICSIAYSAPPCEQLKDHIDMLVKKQVSSSIRNVKNRGIIGVIRVIDHMVWESISNEDRSENMDESFSTIDVLPTKAAKVAANYIELAITSSQHCPNHLALFFDELSSVFSQGNDEHKNRQVNKPFLMWLINTISENFENHFVVENIDAITSTIDLEIMYTLNAADEFGTESTTAIAINVAGTVFEPSANALGSITILTSLFNLLRVLYFRRYNGSLDLINAVLGAGVVLPEVASRDPRVDLFDMFDEEKAKKMVDIYFFTVNYWRECVSAYVSQNEPNMRRKVLTRLTQFIEMEQKIKEILLTVSDDYVPPTCIFLTESSVSRNNILRFKKTFATKKPAAKRKKAAPKTQTTSQHQRTAVETEMDVTIPATDRPNVSNKSTFGINTNLNEFLRSMDPDVILLFEENLNLKYPLPVENIGECLGLLEFKFLLEDLTQKIESIYGVQKFGPSTDSCQSITFPVNYLSDVIVVLPKLFGHFERVVEHLKAISDASANSDITDTDDTEFNDDLFSDEANLVKICFGLCLRLIASLFTWPGFEHDAHQAMLKDALRAITGENHATIGESAIAAIEHISKYADTVMDLNSAVYMFHFCQILTKHSSTKGAYDRFIVPLCKKFLSRKWYSFEGVEGHGGEYNLLLEQLIRGYFKDAKFSLINSHLQIIEAEVAVWTTKGGALKIMPCIKLINFPMLYREVYASLIDSINRKLDKNAISGNQLKVWENSCQIVDKLLDIAKMVDIARIFQFFSKNTHTYLKLFLQHGIDTFEINLQRNTDRAMKFIQTLQISTRFLHTLCCHSKKIKNTVILNQIPQIRETVTQLVYKVKAALAANKCSSGFWVGNLKNKDLLGDEILSQTTSITRSSVSGGNVQDDVDMNIGDGPSASGGKRSSTGVQKSRPKKRKLRSIDEDDNEDEPTDGSRDTSRSRCF